METVEKSMNNVALVFHLAASVGNMRSIDNPSLDSQVNLLGTLNVLEIARKHGIKKIVHSSSAGIFGELKTLPISEDHPQEPDSPYGTSKLAAEKMCLVYNKLYGMNNICLRYFNVYGINQRYDAYGNVIPIFAYGLIKRESMTIYGDGEQTRDFINVDDVAMANWQAATTEQAKGVFNIGSGTQISINKLAATLCKLEGVKTDFYYAPPRKGDVRDSLADISAAQAAFGFCPTVDIEKGLAEYLVWIKSDPLSQKLLKGSIK